MSIDKRSGDDKKEGNGGLEMPRYSLVELHTQAEVPLNLWMDGWIEY